MTYRKEEFDHNGHTVVVQQVRGPESSHGASEPSAWIDGKAAYISDIFETRPYYDLHESESYEDVREVAKEMADNDELFCRDCELFYFIEDSVSTGFAGHKCPTCHNKDRTCEDGDSHDDKCLNPSQKRNARVSTKYKCTKCGRIRKTTPTG